MKGKDSKLLDSSAWLSYFFGQSKEIRKIVESEELLYTSVISLFEIKRKFLREGIDGEELLNFIKERSIIVELNEKIAEEAAEISFKKRLHAIDSLIYTSAKDINAILVTGDKDFEGIDNVIIIK
ncbi:MAG: hypothetical protein DRN29_10775 [Thermoplasmata archaeon]|nr:MAG: hypothetical protein DRN29_10775 [Thermoplasmata archaeon]